VFSPITGQTVPLSQVNDPTFATEILGKGLAILPEEGKVYAPFDGEVASIFETKHAIGMRADNGLELLIHVGLETVRLNGEYFISHVENGQRVKKGDLMLEFDIQAIQAAGYETVTPVIVSNTAVYSEILPLENQKVKALTSIIKAI
jgi:PTS system, glucose subfamily, IIA component